MIAAGGEGRIEVASYPIAPGRIVTARSYLIDRMVPDCELLTLPGRIMPGGAIPYRIVDRLPAPPGRIRLRDRLRRRRPLAPEPLDGSLGIDFRIMSPENWAHFLNFHAPLAFVLTDRLGLATDGLTLILPRRIPGFILRAARHLGLRTQVTDAPAVGPGVVFTLEGNILRPRRRDWVLAGGIVDRLARVDGPPLPHRVLLARRQTRSLSNQPEIEAMLAPRGFQTIYPEDLPVADQFRLFNAAETIVAVHGAGLAPLLYRHPDAGHLRLIELLPCGHMTDVYRAMAQQVGGDWIGVRGRIRPEYVRPAYALGQGFTRFSLDRFEVDPVSLERAMEMVA